MTTGVEAVEKEDDVALFAVVAVIEDVTKVHCRLWDILLLLLYSYRMVWEYRAR